MGGWGKAWRKGLGGVLGLCLGLTLSGAEEPLRFGRVSVEDPSVTLGKYQPLMAALAKHLGRKVELVQAPSYAGMNRLLQEGQVQLGIMNAYSYVQLSEDRRFVAVAKREIRHESGYRCYILVRKDLGAASLADLRGRTFAFSEKNSTTGYLLPQLMLRSAGLVPERDLAETPVIVQHDSLILAVANRTVDAASVASYVFDAYDPQITGKLRILARSAPIPYGPLVVRRDLGPALIARIRTFFLTLHRTPEGRQALADSGFSGFVPARSRDYDAVRRASALMDKTAP